jgi:glycine/D-amino acid oxidase-like deaminating enzyme
MTLLLHFYVRIYVILYIFMWFRQSSFWRANRPGAIPYFCQMQVDVLIVGQGICGTFLSWYIEKAGLSFIVLDEPNPLTASKAAAGLINPVTGRRLVKTWLIDELMPYARSQYKNIGSELGIDCISEESVIDFFPSPQMRNAFLQRMAEDDSYLEQPIEENAWTSLFQYDFGFGIIQPCLLVNLQTLLPLFRKRLINSGKLLEEHFEAKALDLGDVGVKYKEIQAKKIIFCDGIESFYQPFFKDLPFAPNKGEALVLDIPDLSVRKIFKKGMMIIPWKDGLFWVGSSYEWDFRDESPSLAFRNRTVLMLENWLRYPFKIIEQFASVRPATIERRPFVGFHPIYKNLGILNGMGTKACSLAPYFASQLAANLASQSPIMKEVDIDRYSRILSKTSSL